MTPLRQLWQNMITLSDNQIGLAGLALLTGLVSAGLITLFRLAECDKRQLYSQAEKRNQACADKSG